MLDTGSLLPDSRYRMPDVEIGNQLTVMNPDLSGEAGRSGRRQGVAYNS